MVPPYVVRRYIERGPSHGNHLEDASTLIHIVPPGKLTQHHLASATIERDPVKERYLTLSRIRVSYRRDTSKERPTDHTVLSVDISLVSNFQQKN